MRFALQQEPVSKANGPGAVQEGSGRTFHSRSKGRQRESRIFEWMGELKCSSRTGHFSIPSTVCLIILNHDPKLIRAVWHDEFANRAVVDRLHALECVKRTIQAESLGGRGDDSGPVGNI